MMFDAEKVKEACVLWIREFFKENGPDCNAVIGISGGKDSSTFFRALIRKKNNMGRQGRRTLPPMLF